MNTKKPINIEGRGHLDPLEKVSAFLKAAFALLKQTVPYLERIDDVFFYHLGICLAKLELDEEAIDALKTVVSVEPNHVEAYRQMGLLYFLSNQLKEAIKSYNEVLRLCPNDVDAYASLGDCYMGIKDYDKAIEAYKQALQLSPKDKGLHVSLAGALYRKMGRIGPAIKEYNEFAGVDRVSTKIILRDFEVMFGSLEIPGMMETLRKEGLNHDYGKIYSTTIS
jgi:tetratricopeptide (TPR) repeat protein